MILNSIGSKGYIVNLLSDFILNKIGKNENTIINVVDCTNFLIIKGVTSSTEIINLNKIIDEFNSNYNIDNKITHSIDLIEYNKELNPINNLYQTYFNSDNCSYHTKQLELFENSISTDFKYHINEINNNDLVVSSSFPHGYSLSQGRLLYYYGKHIFYSIPPPYNTECLTFKITKDKKESEDIEFKVYDIHGNEDDTLTSAILDVYDFDMSWLENEIKKVDWSIELTNPLIEYDFIKKINRDFVVI